MAHLECNRTVQTMMVWFAYEVSTNVPGGQKWEYIYEYMYYLCQGLLNEFSKLMTESRQFYQLK